jgi:chromosome segregation ATPase
VSQVARASGAAADAILSVIADNWIADSYVGAVAAASATTAAIGTPDGDVFRGAHVVQGGARAEARGILTTKREIKELRERADGDRIAVERLREDLTRLDVLIAGAESAIMSMQGELHRLEKAVVGYDLQMNGAREAGERVARKQDQIATERRSAAEELRVQEARQDEARASISRIEVEQRAADEQLNAAQRRLFQAREAMQAQGQKTAEAKAAHAGLVERASGLAMDIQRLEASSRELADRLESRRQNLQRTHARRTELADGIVASEGKLDADLRGFDEQREQVRVADEHSQVLRGSFEQQEVRIRESRRSLEGVRSEVAHLDVQRATAEADLTHLAASCVESVQATLDEVAAEVEQLEQEGLWAAPRAVVDAPEAAEVEEEGAAP